MDALEKLGVSYDVLQGIMDAEKNFPPVMTAVTSPWHVAGNYAGSSGAGPSSGAGACQDTMSSRNPSCHTHNMT